MTQRRETQKMVMRAWCCDPEPSPTGRVAADLLSRNVTGEVRSVPLTTPHLRAKGRPRHFAISTGCRGHPCPRKRETHGGFHIQSSELPCPHPIPIQCGRFVAPLDRQRLSLLDSLLCLLNHDLILPRL